MKQWLVLLCLCIFGCAQPDQKTEQSAPGFSETAFTARSAKDFYSWTSDRIPLVSAHRGGPYPGYPENAIATFEYIANNTPAVIECDIAMTSDSVLVLMHDSTLDRTTTGSGKVAEHTWKELQALSLKDITGEVTPHKIPTLEETLRWARGKVLFTLDVKKGVPFKKVIEMVKMTDMEAFSAVITYSANDAQEVYGLDSSLMISVGIGNVDAYQAHKSLGIPDENMIAFVGVSEPHPELYEFLHEKGIYCILGALGNLDKKAIAKGDLIYAGFIQRGADILATDRPIEAANILKDLVPEVSTKRQFFHDY